MRWRGFYIIFFIAFSNAYSSSFSDTLLLESGKFDIDVDHALLKVDEQLKIANSDDYQFSNKKLPFNIKSDAILRKQITYNGESAVEIIIEPEGFHYVDVYLKNISEENATLKKTGRLLGYPENELFTTRSVINKVKFTLIPENSYELIIHYKNPNSEGIDIRLRIADLGTWNDMSLKKNSTKNFWLGVFFGTLILLSLVNFIFYYLFQDRTYMVYVGYIFTILIYEASLYGFFDPHFFIQIPTINLVLNNTALIFVVVFYLLFLRSFLNLKLNYPRWNVALKYLIVFLVMILLSTSVMFLLERPISGFSYRNIGLLLILPFAIAFLTQVVFSKRLIDRVFFTGSIILVVSGFVSILIFFYGKSVDSDLILQIGILIEVVIFNIGLGLRSKVLQNEKDQELHQLIIKLQESEEKQKTLNTSLEEKVEKRTLKINEINKELTVQRDQLYEQNETIEQNLAELSDIKNNLEITVDNKTNELRQANKELISQNTQLEQYAFITAHNLKAPIARIKGLLNIFELTNDIHNPNYEIILRIKEASLDMDEVINDINKILEIKNFNQQDRKEVNIEHIIEKIEKRLENQIQENNINIVTDLRVKSVQGIDTYIESILYNLINNGIKYHQSAIESYVQVKSFENGQHVIVEVKDNGIGIDMKQYANKLFGLYQRFHDHVNGKGIGLYLVKTQVEALNGNISISSKVNKGTTFKLSFPAL